LTGKGSLAPLDHTRLHRTASSVNRGYLYTRGVGGAPDKQWWGWAGGVKLTRGRSPEAKALVVKLKKNSDGCTADLIDCLGRYRGWGSVIDEAGFMTNHERQSKCCLQIILSALAVLPISCFSRSQLARACVYVLPACWSGTRAYFSPSLLVTTPGVPGEEPALFLIASLPARNVELK
jgi:hypothetical protein